MVRSLIRRREHCPSLRFAVTRIGVLRRFARSRIRSFSSLLGLSSTRWPRGSVAFVPSSANASSTRWMPPWITGSGEGSPSVSDMVSGARRAPATGARRSQSLFRYGALAPRSRTRRASDVPCPPGGPGCLGVSPRSSPQSRPIAGRARGRVRRPGSRRSERSFPST